LKLLSNFKSFETIEINVTSGLKLLIKAKLRRKIIKMISILIKTFQAYQTITSDQKVKIQLDDA
jgi:hypothetical protein